MKTELRPHDSRNSFYGKAHLIIEWNTVKLQSYNTIVAELDVKTNQVTINGWYSATTARHINAFLVEYGFETMTKKQMLTP